MNKAEIRCKCGKRFPFNPDKHRYDKYVYCPFCLTRHNNPSKRHFKMPKFNLGWLKTKIEQVKQKREAKKFLDKYFKITTPNPRTGLPEERYAFPLNAWMKGKRPTLSAEDIKQALGGNPTQAELLAELSWLSKLGVKVKE